MKTGNKNPALLPGGFADLLPPDAAGESTAISSVMSVFQSFGYARVKPPLLEFEDSLLSGGPGLALTEDTFRLMDPISRRMMGIRSDITPQIARIAATRLGDEARPLRVCYANDVLRISASQQRTARQFTQAGCEIIGANSIEADIESGVLALIALDDLGVRKITIDLAYPEIIADLIKAHKISDAAAGALRGALLKRDPANIKKQLGKKSAVDFIALIESAGPSRDAIKALGKISAPVVKRKIGHLEKIAAGLQRAIDELKLNATITIDISETRGFKYYSGFGFTLFAKNVAAELGRGGRYETEFPGAKSESACGFTLYMDTVRKALPPPPKEKISHVNFDESWQTIRNRHKSGEIVVRKISKTKGS